MKPLDEHDPMFGYIPHRRSTDLDPDKVVFWVMVLLFLIAAAV